jgi:hypothetical protein
MQELLPPERTSAHIYKGVMQRREADSFLEPRMHDADAECGIYPLPLTPYRVSGLPQRPLGSPSKGRPHAVPGGYLGGAG